jgi:hypothetical protein
VQEKGAACPSERYAGKDRVGKAAGAGVQLPEQESGAYCLNANRSHDLVM